MRFVIGDALLHSDRLEDPIEVLDIALRDDVDHYLVKYADGTSEWVECTRIDSFWGRKPPDDPIEAA
jgi:hypothetical protein